METRPEEDAATILSVERMRETVDKPPTITVRATLLRMATALIPEIGLVNETNFRSEVNPEPCAATNFPTLLTRATAEVAPTEIV